MRRRVLFASIAAAAFSPGKSRAQLPLKRAQLGVLLFSTPQADPQVAALRGGLRELGYVDGQNLAIEYRYAEGRPERLPSLAADLVHTKPDVLFFIGGDVAAAGMHATRTIPIVFTSSADPVQLGFVTSIARPSGNATGVTFLLDELAAKRLQLFKETAPAVSRVAFIFNPDHIDNELQEAERAARTLGIQLCPLEVRGSGDFERTFEGATKAGVNGLYVVSSRLTVRNIDRIVAYATGNWLPMGRLGCLGAARRIAVLWTEHQ